MPGLKLLCYQWRENRHHQREILTFLKSIRSSLAVTHPSTGCGVTWRWFGPCWRYFYKPQLSGKSRHFCALSFVFLRVALGEWILLDFQAGLHWFLTGMNTATPCWLHHCVVGAFFCFLRLYWTRLVELDINLRLLVDVNHPAPKTVKITCHGLHPAGLCVPFSMQTIPLWNTL